VWGRVNAGVRQAQIAIYFCAGANVAVMFNRKSTGWNENYEIYNIHKLKSICLLKKHDLSCP
jgi:hypothetical protein